MCEGVCGGRGGGEGWWPNWVCKSSPPLLLPFAKMWPCRPRSFLRVHTVYMPPSFNPLVPRVKKIRHSTLNRLLNFEFVKKMVYPGTLYSERQGLMGYNT